MTTPNRTGQILRERREERNLSLEQIASQAGIPAKYLRLLEGEEVKVGVADALYLVPFLRRYAAFLGLDATELLPEFLGHLHHQPNDTPPPARFSYRSPFRVLWKPALVLSAVAAATIVMMRRAPEPPVFEDIAPPPHAAPVQEAEQAETVADPKQAEIAAEPKQAEVVPAVQETAIATPALDAPALAAVEPTPAPPEAHAIGSRELHLVVTEETWLMLGIDDQPKQSYLLRAGETRTWTANDAFTLTIGNAGGVTISLDGRQLPSLGRSGQVVRNIRLPESTSPPPSG